MAVMLRDALSPNLVQTLERGPAFIHCGPFGNIATGCNSVIADPVAIKLAATTSSPRPGSAPTWAPRGSSTSSAGPADCGPTSPSSS